MTIENIFPKQFSYKNFLFSKEGRINRKMFFAYNIYLGIITSIYNIFEYLIFNNFADIFSFRTLIVLIPIFYITIILTIKRVHDFNRSGWFLLWLLVPIVNFFFIVYIYLKKSDSESNIYGEVPTKEEYLHKLPLEFKITIPLVFVLILLNLIHFKMHGGIVGMHINNFIIKFHNENTLPLKFNDQIVLNDINQDYHTLNFNYQLLNTIKGESNIKQDARINLAKQVCNQKSDAYLILANDGAISYNYYDKNNEHMDSIKITIEDCFQLKANQPKDL